MDLVELIKGQLTGANLSKLSTVLGANEADTAKAATGAVPALLSVLGGAAATSGGAQTLLGALGKFAPGTAGDVLGALGAGNTAGVQKQGNELLTSLLGGGPLAGVLGAVSKYSGLSSGSTSGLLGLLTPLIMGAISNYFKGQPVTPQALTGLFDSQKANISRAMPAGLSLGSIPGLPGMPSLASVKNLAPATPSGLPSWVIPLLGLLVVGLLAYYFLSKPTEVAEVPIEVVKGPARVSSPDPAVAALTGDLTKAYTTTTESLTEVKDEASADAAMPKLKGVIETLDRLKPMFDKLPAPAKTAIIAIGAKNLAPLKELVAKVVALPVIGEKLKPTLDDLVTKLSAFAA